MYDMNVGKYHVSFYPVFSICSLFHHTCLCWWNVPWFIPAFFSNTLDITYLCIQCWKVPRFHICLLFQHTRLWRREVPCFNLAFVSNMYDKTYWPVWCWNAPHFHVAFISYLEQVLVYLIRKYNVSVFDFFYALMM